MAKKISQILDCNLDGLTDDASTFLSRLISIPSTPGLELAAMDYVTEAFEALDVDVEKVWLSDDIIHDLDYSSPIPDIKYEGRYNLRISRKGKRQGVKLLLNAHIDVVPASEGMDEPWSGKNEAGVIYGRGACDDKGSLACIYMLFRLLQEMDFDFSGEIVAHIVVEEENGGNGSLAMVRSGEIADECIVLEPTDGRILSSIRGAVWFKIDLQGKAGHSGQVGQTKSALLMAIDAIDALTNYHRRLLDSSRGIELFDKYENPMPITFGKLNAGNWPAAAPSKATIEGVLGLLPNKTKEDVCNEMAESLYSCGKGLSEENCKLSFTYKHDCSVTDTGHSLVQGLMKASGEVGINLEIDAMTASCDAWLYNNQLKIPTVVYGPGTLSVAHSKDEHIQVSDIKNACVVLANYIMERK